MIVKNALKRLEKAAGNITIHNHSSNDRPWMASAKFGDWVVEFLANGRWEDDAEIVCIRVKKNNDHDDSMSDYCAGSFRDNLKQAIDGARYLSAQA